LSILPTLGTRCGTPKDCLYVITNFLIKHGYEDKPAAEASCYLAESPLKILGST
jgi:hypothetical protein